MVTTNENVTDSIAISDSVSTNPDGGQAWNSGDILSKLRMNLKTILIDMGSNIKNFPNPLTGMLAYCTATGSGLIIGNYYYYNGTAWTPIKSTTVFDSIKIDYTIPNKPHYVEWFCGKQYDSNRWALTSASGTPAAPITSAEGDGIDIQSGATNGNDALLDFNNICQFVHNGAIFIATVKFPTTTSILAYIGFNSKTVGTFFSTDFAMVGIHTTVSATNYIVYSSDGVSGTEEDTGIAFDNNYHDHKLVLRSGGIDWYLDGVLKYTKTTHLPTIKQGPVFYVRTLTSSARDLKVLFNEGLCT